MWRHRVRILATLFGLILFSIRAEASEARKYQVLQGDQLGQLLMDLGYSPLWGPRGAVQKVLNLNSASLFLGDDHRVLAGTTLLLPPLDAPQEPSPSMSMESLSKNDQTSEVPHEKVATQETRFQVDAGIGAALVGLSQYGTQSSLSGTALSLVAFHMGARIESETITVESHYSQKGFEVVNSATQVGSSVVNRVFGAEMIRDSWSFGLLGLSVPNLFYVGTSGYNWGDLQGYGPALGWRKVQILGSSPEENLFVLQFKARVSPLVLGSGGVGSVRIQSLYGVSLGFQSRITKKITPALDWGFQSEVSSYGIRYKSNLMGPLTAVGFDFLNSLFLTYGW
jgi:hypothetical protein